MRIVEYGTIRVSTTGQITAQGWEIEDDEAGLATWQALAEFAWLEAMYADAAPKPLSPVVMEVLRDLDEE